jgi:anti-anti-sigma factor
MQLTTTQTGDVLVVTVEEPRLDRKTHVLFRKKLAAHFRPGVKIALGLGRVSYADGPGYGAVLTLHREAVALGGDIKIFSLNHSVRTVFQKLRLHRRMETFNLEEEAVRAFGRLD